MFLVSYLVFFLTGLAYGLAQDNRTSIDKWEADAIVLTDESNLNVNMSIMPRGKVGDIEAEEVAALGQTGGVVRKGEKSCECEKINTNFYGINKEEFLMPEVIEGRAFTDDYEVVADYSLYEEEGIEIGDTLNLAGSELTVEVVGFTEDAKLSVAPVLYTTMATYQDIRFETIDESDEGRISAFIIRNDDLAAVNIKNDDLVLYDIKEILKIIKGVSEKTHGFNRGMNRVSDALFST